MSDAVSFNGSNGGRMPSDYLFTNLCEYWLHNRAVNKRSFKDDLSIIRKHLLPHFGGLKVSDINVSDVDRYIAAKPHLTRKTISNHLTLFISLLNMAFEMGIIIKVPKIRKPKIFQCDTDFNFLRTDHEIQRFLTAAKHIGDEIYTLCAAAIYTGMRQGELAELRWVNVDFQRRLITVKNSFLGPTKSGEIRYVPILDPLLMLLKQWRLRCPNELVFPNRVGNMRRPSDRIFQETFKKVLDRAEFPKILKHKKRRHYIVFHDLRHTFASHWVMKGGDIFKLQKILGHKSIQMTLRYSHLDPNAFASDYGRFSQILPASNSDEAKVAKIF